MPTPDDPILSTSASDQARRQAKLASLVDQGIAAARQGHRQRARRLLEAALTIDPGNEEAWLWLAALTDDRGLARAMFLRVVDEHPESVRARDALHWLDRAAESPSTGDRVVDGCTPPSASGAGGVSQDEPPFVPPWDRAGETAEATGAASSILERPVGESGPSPLPRDAPAEGVQELEAGTIASFPASVVAAESRRPAGGHVRPAVAWQRLSQRLGAMPRGELVRRGAMVGLVGFLAVGSLSLVSLLSSPSRAASVRVALGVITETPTVTPSPTATLTPSVTPTPTHTPTVTPSPTPSPTITPTPSPTATPAWLTAKILPLPLDEKWIEVDLTTQTLYAYEGETRVFTATVSTGKGNTPTIQGKYRIQRKYEAQAMAGPGYYLPNVPYIMYFYANFALHGAYWHDKWGTPTSHGCVNLKREDAKWLYDWTDPPVPEGATSVVAGPTNQGTWVIVHK